MTWSKLVLLWKPYGCEMTVIVSKRARSLKSSDDLKPMVNRESLLNLPPSEEDKLQLTGEMCGT